MSRRLRVLFRVAAGPRIGFGHLVRCRTLARARGVQAVFSIRGSSTTVQTARQLGCRVVDAPVGLPSEYDLLVVDDPKSDTAGRWLRRGRLAGRPVAAIRDLGASGEAADLVVDGSITAESGVAGQAIGTQFTLLDPAVLTVRRARSARRSTTLHTRPRILVALGGGQHVRSCASAIVRAIYSKIPDAVIEVVAGFGTAAVPPLGGTARWVSRPDGLLKDLARCDIAVVAGGMTLYEACAAGVPTVALAVVPAQQPAIRAFAARGAVTDAGLLDREGRGAEKVGRGVAYLLGDDQVRDAQVRAARRAVDGRGSLRVGQMLRTLAQEGRHV